jgi:hypothetical protein
MPAPINTPWGEVQQQTKLADGIYTVSTAGHGGFWLDESHRNRMPDVKNWLQSKTWWEEDCDWAKPFVRFADEIKAFGYYGDRFDMVLADAKASIAFWDKEEKSK